MKAVLFFAALALFVALALGQNGCVRDDSDGQPLCNAEEMTARLWRNNWDPTAYWECETANTPATYRRCPTEGMFNGATRTCINWFDWEWTPTCKPPSRVTKKCCCKGGPVHERKSYWSQKHSL